MFGRLIKTKTFWTGVVSIAGGAGLICMGDVPTGIQTILGGIALIFLRDGIAKTAEK